MIRGSQTEGNIDTVIFSIIEISLFCSFSALPPRLSLCFQIECVRVCPGRGARGAHAAIKMLMRS